MNRLYSLKQPVIFAHRGSSLYVPENTMPAFLKAVNDGADAIELDVKLTTDNQVVVIHDHTLERTTDGTGFVAEMSWKQLNQYDAGSWFSESFRGTKIPLLREVIEELGKIIFINIEITNYHTRDDLLVDEVVRLVCDYDIVEHVMFSSFLPRNLIKAKRLLPQVPVGLLALPGFKGLLPRWFPGILASTKIVHPNVNDISERYMLREHQAGRRIHVWTVNDPENIQKMVGMNVDGIFTDDPITALLLAGRAQG